MRNKLNLEQQSSINFINELSLNGILNWPIDYESNFQTDEELAITFGYWFGNDHWSKDGDTFVQFGQDGTGSMFLLWFYPNLKIEPPVVFMGSEGESFIVSNRISDFAKQLASGKLFFDGCWLEPEADEEIQVDWAVLKSKIEIEFGKITERPEALTELAKSKHPSFSSWIESKCN